MVSRLAPPKKKLLAYRKDHVSQAEYPHAQRKTWPRVKAISKREERRKVRQDLAALLTRPEDQVDFTMQLIRRKPVHKRCGVVTLEQAVEHRLRKRARQTGWNLFKHPYDAEEHRERFSTLLQSITQSGSRYAKEFARMISELLIPKELPHRFHVAARQREWLQAFLKDVPEWEARLRVWVTHGPTST